MVDIPILNGGYKPAQNWGGTTLQGCSSVVRESKVAGKVPKLGYDTGLSSIIGKSPNLGIYYYII
jgi:hypothetical protein